MREKSIFKMNGFAALIIALLCIGFGIYINRYWNVSLQKITGGIVHYL